MRPGVNNDGKIPFECLKVRVDIRVRVKVNAKVKVKVGC